MNGPKHFEVLTHRVRLEVGLEDLPLGVVDALGLLEEARHEVREEGLEVDGRHVEHARSYLFPQLAGQVVCNNVALVRAKGAKFCNIEMRLLN